jgi:hypothetical protein
MKSDHVITEGVATRLLRTKVDLMIIVKNLDRWYGICRAKRRQWVFEDALLAFNSLEAWPYLKQFEEQQCQTRLFKEGKN